MTGETKLTDAGSIKEGNYIMMGGIACIVKNIQTSRPGKHGHAKCRIEAVGIIDGQKKIEIYLSHDKVHVPIIDKRDAQVLSIKEDVATVMDMKTYETIDLKIPEDLKDKVKEGGNISYWLIGEDKVLKQVK